MALVTFGSYWINPVIALDAGMSFRLGNVTRTPQLQGTVDQFGTRLRGTATSVTARQQTVTLRCDTRDQVEFLRVNQGATCCHRDPRNEKFYGWYLDPSIPEMLSPNSPLTVTFTVNEITVSETG